MLNRNSKGKLEFDTQTLEIFIEDLLDMCINKNEIDFVKKEVKSCLEYSCENRINELEEI